MMKKRNVFQKSASLILALLMIVFTFVTVPFSASAETPDLTIGSAADLIEFKAAVVDGETFEGKTVQLTADIDMSGVETADWPVATGTTYAIFSGIFDGNGKSIKNPEVTLGNWRGFLFDNLHGATVKNLRVEGGAITVGTGGAVISAQVSGAGDKKALIQNVYISTMLTATNQYVGAMIGSVQNEVTIENCVVESVINGNSKANIAGFVGDLRAVPLTLKNCAFLGSVTTGTANRAGAFVAWNRGATLIVTNCANMGTVTGNLGSAVSGDTVNVDNFADTLAAYGVDWTQTGATRMMPASVAKMLGKRYVAPTENWLTANFDGDETYTIGSAADLLAFKELVVAGTDFNGKTVQLIADIDMSGVEWPYFSSYNYYFKGTFDGRGYAIMNINAINTTSNWCGVLFSFLDGAIVKNLSMVGGTYTTTKQGSGVIAGITQTNKCTFENIYVNYTVNSSTTGGNAGDTGILLGRVQIETDVINCVVDGSLNGGSGTNISGVGGFVGRTKGNLNATNCAFLGSVTTSSTRGYSGSLIGLNESGTINVVTCADMGTVTAGRGQITDHSAYGVTNVTSENLAATLAAFGKAWTQTDKTQMMPASVAEMLGKAYIKNNLYYQRATSLNEDGTVNVRFITVIDTLDFAEVGFNITITRIDPDGNSETSSTISLPTTIVYESINALGDTITAEELGGKYIVAVVISGIDCANYAHEIAVEAYVKNTSGSNATPTASATVTLARTTATA